MAPKRASPKLVKASNKLAKLSAKADAKLQGATTTLAKAELSVPVSSASTRCLRRRTSEQTTAKIVRDNFPTFTPTQTDDKVNEKGNTLRQQLRLDRKDPQVRMGLKYYAAMRVVYDDDMSPFRQLRVIDPSEPINPMVEEAIMGLESHPTNLVPMQALFCVDVDLSQRNIVAILKGLLKLRTCSSMPRLSVLIEGMRWLQRNRVDVRFKQEVAVCRRHFDEVMSKHHDIVTCVGRTTAEWWELVRDVGSLAFSAEDFSKCVSHDGEWQQVSESLGKLVCESLTGKKIFGAAYKTIEAENMQQLVLDCSAEILGWAKIDKAALVRGRTSFSAKAEARGVNVTAAFAKNKELPIMYRGVQIKVWCHSYLDYFNSMTVACVKGVAVDINVLKPCLCEDDLVSQPRPPLKIAIELDLLIEAKIARTQVAEWALELEDMTGESIQNMFRSKLGMLKAIDKHVIIEDAFFSAMCGDSGHTMFKKSVLQCLPGEFNHMTWQASRAQLEKLVATPFAKYCGKGLLSQSHTILAWLRSGEAGRAPQCGSLTAEFLVTARTAMANFLVHIVDIGVEEVGKTALDSIFRELSAFCEKDGKPTLQQLKPFVMFKWLLDPSQDTLAQKWTDLALLAGAKPAIVVPAVEPPAKKRRAKAQTADFEETVSKQVVASYFD
jgi:hypothetical protein